MLRRTPLAMCFVDHAAHYSATRPRRPCAAFTGQAFPEHVTRSLEIHAQRAGFASPYWITRAVVRQHRVPMKPDQSGIAICMEEKAIAPIEVFHAEHVHPSELLAFLSEVPVPDPLGPQPFRPPSDRDAHGGLNLPWLLRDHKWRRVSHTGAVAALRRFRVSQGLTCDIWLSSDSVASAGLTLLGGAHSIPVNEVPSTVFFNVEQSTYAIERFAAPYAPPGTCEDDLVDHKHQAQPFHDRFASRSLTSLNSKREAAIASQQQQEPSLGRWPGNAPVNTRDRGPSVSEVSRIANKIAAQQRIASGSSSSSRYAPPTSTASSRNSGDFCEPEF
jgi:hypothetical protein